MTGYVLDASEIMELLIAGPLHERTLEFLRLIEEEEARVVPDFCLLECTNTIWKQARFHGWSTNDAMSTMETLQGLGLQCVESGEFLKETLKLTLTHNLTVYDSCYLAMAVDFGYSLVSLDRRQLRAASAEGLSLVNIASQPL